jgi:hypothetical protein
VLTESALRLLVAFAAIMREMDSPAENPPRKWLRCSAIEFSDAAPSK